MFQYLQLSGQALRGTRCFRPSERASAALGRLSWGTATSPLIRTSDAFCQISAEDSPAGTEHVDTHLMSDAQRHQLTSVSYSTSSIFGKSFIFHGVTQEATPLTAAPTAGVFFSTREGGEKEQLQSGLRVSFNISTLWSNTTNTSKHWDKPSISIQNRLQPPSETREAK